MSEPRATRARPKRTKVVSASSNTDMPGAMTVESWMQQRGWHPFDFQQQVWNCLQQGKSGLLHATTGTGKTLAVWGGVLAREAQRKPAPYTALWLTPMRALAADTARNLSEIMTSILPDWTIALRTGDSSSAERQRQERQPPTALVTTPESLSLMLSRAQAQASLGQVRYIIVDEWHELLGNKRGVQTQLALARLLRWNPQCVVWGLSATLGDLEIARQALCPEGVLVHAIAKKSLQIESLIPTNIERFPWGGHLGLRLLPEVVQALDSATSSLVFTNTRSQAELWYQALLEARPDWAGLIALHHGSLDKEVRDWVEQGLKQGHLKVVVCTSSLDLGVDFLPVERVLQIGSPKGIARLLQRAGRSGHAPGRSSRVTLVPTQAWELVEAAAARAAAEQQQIEARHPPEQPMDVLIQHLVTVALGGGFEPEELWQEITSTYSYRQLSRAAFQWALTFVERGGQSLQAYPDFHRVVCDEYGRYTVPSASIARRHRMSIGTIVSDGSVNVCWLTGGRLGQVEESFIARLKRGDGFVFSGRVLELVRVENMTAYVRKASQQRGTVPQWQGGKMPLSTELAAATLQQLAQAQAGRYDSPELHAVRPLLELQSRWSVLPGPDTLLVECLSSKEGHHLFCYPFAGRLVHQGLATVLAWRAAQQQSGTFSIAINDYGFELLSPQAFDWPKLLQQGLFSTDHLLEDIVAALNSSELAQRRFREIARIAGLVLTGYPGAPRSQRQLQASARLFHEVFARHDPDNLLLQQAQTEVLQHELDWQRLQQALARMQQQILHFQQLSQPTPLAFPLMIERLRERLSTEKLSDRVQRLLQALEQAAG